MKVHDKQDKQELEKTKLAVDVMKHLTTLSTGSVVVVVTLYDKSRISGMGVSIALDCMVASLLLSVVYLFLGGMWEGDTRHWLMVSVAGFSFAAFVFGLGILTGAVRF